MDTKVARWECGDDKDVADKKYIVTTDADHERVVMWIFPQSLTHKEVAGRKTRGVILGAGMIGDLGDGPECYGESTTLHVRSRAAADTKILREWLATHDSA